MSVTTAEPKPATRERQQIPARFTWDLAQIFPDWEAWRAGLDELQTLMVRYQDYRDRLAEGPATLLAVCRLGDELGQLAYRVYQYPGLMRSEDTRDNRIQARLAEVQAAFAEFEQAKAWFTPELLAIPEATVRAWLDAEPALAPYRFGLEEAYRLREHTLDEAGERLLAYAGRFAANPRETYSMLADADVQFPTVELSDGRRVVVSHANSMAELRSNRHQADRETVLKAYLSVYDSAPNTYAAVYSGVLQRDWFLARSRSYLSTLAAALDPDAVPLSVYTNLLAAALAGAEPLRRYHRLRRRALGLERYRYFDGYLPLVDVAWPLYYDQVRAPLLTSVAPLGDDYRRTVERALDERWIDVYENQGKRSGAFSAGVYGVHPYMLLNYADTLEDGFTVAHEMGHTMHTVLSHEAQPFATSEYTIFVAEVASMTNEELFLDVLLDATDDPHCRAVLLQRAIDDLAGGFFRQAMFADFELRAHRLTEEGRPITAEVLQGVYLEVLVGYFGDTLDDQEIYRNAWAGIPHFFASPYYVYQYATAKAAAALMHRRMTSGPEAERRAAVAAYLTLLRSGGDDHPVMQLQQAGVDHTTPEPVEALVAHMGQLVEQLEGALTELGVG